MATADARNSDGPNSSSRAPNFSKMNVVVQLKSTPETTFAAMKASISKSTVGVRIRSGRNCESGT